MAEQLSHVAQSFDAMLAHMPLRHALLAGDGSNLAVLDRPIQQKLVVAETAADCEAAAALMLSSLEDLRRGKSTVAAVGLDTEWAPPGEQHVVRLKPQQS